MISRGLPIFGGFCKLLRNILTETFAEPSENWEVSSNRILTGRPSSSFIQGRVRTAQEKPGKLGKGTFMKNFKANLENSGNFLTILQPQGKPREFHSA